MVDELFGPVVTIYVYPAGEFEKTVIYLLLLFILMIIYFYLVGNRG